MGSGKDQIDLYYFGRGHTNGDTFVVFPALRTMHVGDMFAWKALPYIDPDNGGSVVEQPKSLARAAAVRNVDTIINGHIPVGTIKDLQEYAAFTADFVAFAERSLKAGKSAEQAAKEYTVDPKYKGYQASANPMFGGPQPNLEIAYKELKKVAEATVMATDSPGGTPSSTARPRRRSSRCPSGRCPPSRRAKWTCAFTDYPDTFAASPANGERRFLDLRKIDGLITPNDQFFFIQHYNRPELDPAKHRIKVTGLVKTPLELSLADLQAMPKAEIVNGYECSGNSGRAMQGLSSNGRFAGVRLRDVLRARGRRRRRARGGVLRRRPRQGRRGLPAADVQDRAAVRPQHHAGERAEAGAACWSTRSTASRSRATAVSRCAW